MTKRWTLLPALLGLWLAAAPALAGSLLYVLPREDTSGKRAVLQALQANPAVAAVEKAVPDIERPDRARLNRWLRVQTVDTQDETALLQQLQNDPAVEYAEPAPVRTTSGLNDLDGLPNDPLAVYQWHLDDINAFAAWDEIGDASGVVVAVIDNGFDLNHPDLRNVLWTNSAEANGHIGTDDDHNGYVDDIHGWNSYNGNGNPSAPAQPTDADHHGTHCAGIALAAHNNRIGVSGVAPGARLMALKAGQGNQIAGGVEALVYAADNGADIVSMSYSGPAESVFERDAVQYALSQGVVLVAAAGNDHTTQKNYPAAYDGVIGVAATDEHNQIPYFSNTGDWVDIAAPGVDILSTIIGGYGYETGTSMATPLVAGIAALVRAQDPEATVEKVRARLLQGSRFVTTNDPNALPRTRVDAWRTALAFRPTVLVDDMTFVDEDGDGVIEPGESVDLTLHLELVGPTADNVSVHLQSLNNGLQADGVQSWTGLAPGVFDTETFTVIVGQSAARGSLPILFQVNCDGWQESRTLDVPVDPRWRAHDAGGMVATVSDFGAIGYRDYVRNSDRPKGIRLDDQPLGMLFHGSLMVTDGTAVSDCAYGNNSQTRYDFLTASGGELRRASSSGDRVTYQARYTDANQTGTVGLVVSQTSTGYLEGDNVLYIDYDVTPIASSSANLNVGIFCDWDIRPGYNNIVLYDEAHRLSYMVGETGAAGIMALGSTPIAAVRAIDNQAIIYDGFTDQEKALLLTGAMGTEEDQSAGDLSHLVSLRFTNVTPSSPAHARFALLAAHSSQELLAMAGRVTTLAQRSAGENGGALPAVLTLDPAWPNPFNSATSFRVILPDAGRLQVSVFDILGRRVAALADERHAAGQVRIEWDGHNAAGSDAASGTYLIRAQLDKQQDTRRITLVR